ncbi:hypothetical protein BV20DRAFT_366756 [Pilatotrama ljubarskyi]|nr:hypothetical protein BV20DRAFT_366756 [Pilatotrama ljubarskyi]
MYMLRSRRRWLYSRVRANGARQRVHSPKLCVDVRACLAERVSLGSRVEPIEELKMGCGSRCKRRVMNDAPAHAVGICWLASAHRCSNTARTL